MAWQWKAMLSGEVLLFSSLLVQIVITLSRFLILVRVFFNFARESWRSWPGLNPNSAIMYFLSYVDGINNGFGETNT
jgi:hypothetical protein